MLTLSQYKKVINIFETIENGAKKDKLTHVNDTAQLEVIFENLEGVNESIKICLDDRVVDAIIVKNTEGVFSIIINPDLLNNLESLFGAVAHEVGHYLSGHLNSTRSNGISSNLRKQELYKGRFYETKEDKDADRYLRATYFGLFKGGVFNKELEADMKALEYVSTQTLIHMHLYFSKNENHILKLERMNRIQLLNDEKPRTLKHFEISSLQ